MLIIPKLEIAGGTLAHGTSAGAFGGDPVRAARGWAGDGFNRIQIVDRDALGGRRPNYSLIESFARDASVEVDVSAGAESADQIESWVDSGAAHVGLGSRALAEDDGLRSMIESFPAVLTLETSVRQRRLTTRGWVRLLSIDLLDLVDDLAGLPIAALLVSAPPGTAMELTLLEDVTDASSFPVLVEDSHPTMGALRAFEHRGVAGVVVPAAALATALDPRAVANEFVR